MPPESILKTIADNPALLKAVKEIIEKKFSLDEINNQMSNEMMGQVVRARIDGLLLVGSAFKEIERHKTITEPKLEDNPAR